MIGQYDPSTIYSDNVVINESTTPNIVRVTLRRDGVVNPRTPLIFGQVLGFEDAGVEVTATAVLPQPDQIRPGTAVLPFAFDQSQWDTMVNGDSFIVYGDGGMTDGDGNSIPGNWGTLDIGASNNSTSDLADQISNGLQPSDLDALHSEGRIGQNTHIDSNISANLQGDPGLSSGMKSAVQGGTGEQYLIPLFDQVSGGGGNNVQYRVVGWAAVTLEGSNWKGSKNTWVEVTKSSMYDGHLTASNGSLDTVSPIDGVFGAPILIR